MDFLLGAHASDSDGEGYRSAEDEYVQKGGRSPKRRRLSQTPGVDETTGDRELKETIISVESQTTDNVGKRAKRPRSASPPSISKPLSKKNLVSTDAAIKASGVIYISRLPPFMKPSKLRSLLTPYGTINRIFLSPEEASAHARRVRNGGNKKRSFVDGWVEFVRKIDAKRACELLNGQIIGGKKGTFYHDDIWNLLYLKGFKWRNLTEQIEAENAERASRMRAEISRVTRENREFVGNVERAKMLDGIERKKGVDVEDQVPEATEHEAITVTSRAERSEERPAKRDKEGPRHFKQSATAPVKAAKTQTADVKRVLSKIF